MSTTTTNPGRCDCCGIDADTRDDNEYCLDCQYRDIQCEWCELEAIQKVLGGAVDAALAYMAPGDVYELVAESVKRTGCDGAASIAVLRGRSHYVSTARLARLEPSSDIGSGGDA
jgi:hypothetical protein